MDNDISRKPRLILYFFIIQVLINWLYVLWIKSLPDIIINSWFVVLPLLGYFYFTFAFIACVWLFYKRKSGLYLAYCVLMVGSTFDVISYNLVYKMNFLIEQLIIPLIAINCCVIFYMACNQSYFKSD